MAYTHYRAQIGELDVSEEAEELREALYDIVSEHATGIDSKYLEELYQKRYVETEHGKSLPHDWLKQLEIAGEFEVKRQAGLVTVYIVHKGVAYAPSFIPAVSAANDPDLGALKTALPQIATTDATQQDATPVAATVTEQGIHRVLSVSPAGYFYALSDKRAAAFDAFNASLVQYYTEHYKNPEIAVSTPVVNEIYVVLDTAHEWCRVQVKDFDGDSSIPLCFLIDYGELRSEVRSSFKVLDASLAVDVYPPFARCNAVDDIEPSLASSMPHLRTSTCRDPNELIKVESRKVRFLSVDEKGDYDIVKLADTNGAALSSGFLSHLSTPSISSSTTVPSTKPAIQMNIVSREPSEMPNKKVKIYVMSVTDPDNISIRLEAWYPAPVYLSQAIARDSENTAPPNPSEVAENQYYATKLDDNWERVQIVRQSSTSPGGEYWVVYFIDVGYFHLLHVSQLRSLTDSVSAFKKILLAKCRLSGIKPNNTGVWSSEIQSAIQDILSAASNSVIEFTPTEEWKEFEAFSAAKLPYASGCIHIDDKDLAEQLVSMGLAEKAD